MSGLLPWVLLVGIALVVEALLARHEVLAYSIGLRTPASKLTEGMPYARGALPDRPPDGYLVYLDGIGKRRFADSRDGGQLVRALIDAAPELRILGQVQPYSPLSHPLADRRAWKFIRRRAGILLFLHNVMQIFVAADRRYRPFYNRAVGTQIAAQLQLAGYRPGSGIPIVLLSYSGGAQVATGAVDRLRADLLAPPVLLVAIGGFHNGANDLAGITHFHQITSRRDRIEPVSAWLFPPRWRLWRPSPWNRAVRDGKVTVHWLDPSSHVGPHSYISPDARLPDGRTYLARTTDLIVAIVRDFYVTLRSERA